MSARKLVAFVALLPLQLARATALADAPATSPARDVLYLKSTPCTTPANHLPLIARELYRQAVLIAARDGLGLATRDQALREWNEAPPAELTLITSSNNGRILLQQEPPGTAPLWQHQLRGNSQSWGADLVEECEQAEKLSRDDFVSLLSDQGWEGKPNAINPAGAAPADAEALLAHMEELSQLRLLRETHALIRGDGESPQRLGVLVRAYANLGQLTQYHWSLEDKVYAARSLLYAQRMVAGDPKSAAALWHRAYARAMVGLPKAALDDLSAAAALQPAQPPDWVAAITAYCKYQTSALLELAGANHGANLAWYLAFLSVELSKSQGAVMSVAEGALTSDADCLRIVDEMCEESGPGMLNRLTEIGPQVFDKTLNAELWKMPQIPKAALERRNIAGWQSSDQDWIDVCDLLLRDSAPKADRGEPSWGAVSRLIQETNFVQLRRRAKLIAEQWGVDASGFAEQERPAVAQHPFRRMIDIYGLEHEASAAPLVAALQQQPRDDLQLIESDLFTLVQHYVGPRSKAAGDAGLLAFLDSDADIGDLENLVPLTGASPTPYGKLLLDRLREISPDSPILVASLIQTHFTDAAAKKWEETYGSNPTVTMALARKYAALSRFSDAIRCVREYLAIVPDSGAYWQLAGIYEVEHDDAHYVATLKEAIDKTEDYGLQHAQFQVAIANDYMRQSRYADALPYADAAAQTASAWGLKCAAAAHTGTHDFQGAEALLVDEYQHYSSSPYEWYAWCIQTGHGNHDAAAAATRQYLAAKGDNLGPEDLIQLACIDILDKKDAEALGYFQQRMQRYPGPLSLMHVITLADRLHDAAALKDALSKVDKLKEKGPETAFCKVLKKAYDDKGNHTLDTAAVDPLLAKATLANRVAMVYQVVCYLQRHDQNDAALKYLKSCRCAYSGYVVDLPLVDQMLHDQKIDPLTPDSSPGAGTE